MKTKELIQKLKSSNDKALLFEYTQNQVADTNYHLTEVKNVNFETVDCGGNINNWKETHLQLWESPNEKGKEDYMTVAKVIAILERVDSINPLWLDTDVKIEFGNATFHTSILDITDFEENKEQLIVKLHSVKTACKAPSSCVPDSLKEAIDNDACCATESKCC